MTNQNLPPRALPSSFRDPSGFVFSHEGVIYRQINLSYQPAYDQLMQSGLYKTLTQNQWLIPHREVSEPKTSLSAYKIIRPESIPFISYPYEWSFSQLKDAALLTLTIQKKAMEAGLSLKDCSAYNIQFHEGKPVFIDTLSFEIYSEGKPWVAYQQFCQHFVAPLSLMALKDIRLNQLLRTYVDGIPLDLASTLLPFSTRFNFFLGTHIHLHAKNQKQFSQNKTPQTPPSISRKSLEAIIDHLVSGIRNLQWKPKTSHWTEYYETCTYSSSALEAKKAFVKKAVNQSQPKKVWDLGANTGLFSRLVSDAGISTIAFESDPLAVEKNYKDCVEKKEKCLLPLWLDLVNPSPGLGWAHEERMSLVDRGPADMVFALALIHHLAIANNLPFEKIAAFLKNITPSLVIEFVPKEDPQTQRLLANRQNIFEDYKQDFFERAFKLYFTIEEVFAIPGSPRTLYLMQRK